MRNTSGKERVAWATFAKAARETAQGGKGFSQSELARRLKVDRVTVWRWEKGEQRPDDARVVARFAEIVGVDQDEALAAAGLKPDVEAPAEPTREIDEELEMILRAKIPERYKIELLDMLERDRSADRERRIERYGRIIHLYGRGA